MRITVRLLRDDRGASAAEYALILAIIGSAIAIAAIGLGGAISTSITQAEQNIATCGGGC